MAKSSGSGGRSGQGGGVASSIRKLNPGETHTFQGRDGIEFKVRAYQGGGRSGSTRYEIHARQGKGSFENLGSGNLDDVLGDLPNMTG